MVEALFFSCYYSYLLGNLEKTSLYYSLLKEEFKNNGKRDSLREHQFRELKKIKIALDTGNITTKKWIEDDPIIGSPQVETSDMKQKELVRKIHEQGLNQLKDIVQDDLYLYNIEHPCPPYGQVDMVYRGKDTVYPIEVKKDIGKHDLIGQIYKYDLFHRLMLHYKHYDFVKSVTICQAYQPYVVTELKQMDVVTILYSWNDKIILKKT
jgi:hypothetical protein